MDLKPHELVGVCCNSHLFCRHFHMVRNFKAVWTFSSGTTCIEDGFLVALIFAGNLALSNRLVEGGHWHRLSFQVYHTLGHWSFVLANGRNIYAALLAS